jgi:hypothetical protein
LSVLLFFVVQIQVQDDGNDAKVRLKAYFRTSGRKGIMKFIIITNNRRAYDKFKEPGSTKNLGELVYLDGMEYIDVLERVRDYVHKGHTLLTHPLSGSIKPYETPYKSVIVSLKSDVKDGVYQVDPQSLKIIEESLETTRKFQRDHKERAYTDRHHEEFMIIDLHIIDSGIESINAAI